MRSMLKIIAIIFLFSTTCNASQIKLQYKEGEIFGLPILSNQWDTFYNDHGDCRKFVEVYGIPL